MEKYKGREAIAGASTILEAKRGSAGRIAAEIDAAVDAGAPATGLYTGAILRHTSAFSTG